MSFLTQSTASKEAPKPKPVIQALKAAELAAKRVCFPSILYSRKKKKRRNVLEKKSSANKQLKRERN